MCRGACHSYGFRSPQIRSAGDRSPATQATRRNEKLDVALEVEWRKPRGWKQSIIEAPGRHVNPDDADFENFLKQDPLAHDEYSSP